MLTFILRDVFPLRCFPCHECLLGTQYIVPVFAATYSVCVMARATFIVYKASLLDPKIGIS